MDYHVHYCKYVRFVIGSFVVLEELFVRHHQQFQVPMNALHASGGDI